MVFPNVRTNLFMPWKVWIVEDYAYAKYHMLKLSNSWIKSSNSMVPTSPNIDGALWWLHSYPPCPTTWNNVVTNFEVNLFLNYKLLAISQWRWCGWFESHPCWVKPLMIITLCLVLKFDAPFMVNFNLKLGIQIGTFDH